jgi:hypothetical protein
MMRRLVIAAIIGLTLLSIGTSGYALWAHRALRRAQDQHRALLVALKGSHEKVSDFVCDGIDGIDCYRVLREYHSKGRGAAAELRSTLVRSQGQ